MQYRGLTPIFGGWRLAVGGWRLAVGGWRLAVGGWRLAVDVKQRKKREIKENIRNMQYRGLTPILL